MGWEQRGGGGTAQRRRLGLDASLEGERFLPFIVGDDGQVCPAALTLTFRAATRAQTSLTHGHEPRISFPVASKYAFHEARGCVWLQLSRHYIVTKTQTADVKRTLDISILRKTTTKKAGQMSSAQRHT